LCSTLAHGCSWLAVASPLFATATQLGGVTLAVLAALALMVGVGLGDCGVVLVGGLGVRRAGQGVERWVRRALAVVLAGVGLWLIIVGAFS
jgi:threonine/homoserine/homoserine lactone efflux protein